MIIEWLAKSLKNDFGDKLSFSLFDLKTLVHCVCSWKYYLTSNVSPIICIFCFILILKGLLLSVSIFCRNDELSSMMSWVSCLLKDSELFILFEENSQTLLKISVIPILLTFMYLVALNLLVNNQLNSSSNSTHHWGRN